MAEPSTIAERSGQNTANDDRFKLLIVDDSRLQRTLVKSHLKSWGFEVFEADSGVSALKVCEEQPIDLILSDWVMPEMSGIEFCEAFRKLDREKYGYFVLLTSKGDKEDVAAGLEVGADDFLTKPVNVSELQARIRAGYRIMNMQRELQSKNLAVQEALGEVQHLYSEINKDLAEAEKLQKSLIPEPSIDVKNGHIANVFQSSGHVGGDLVGQFALDENRLAVFSADVSGHGVSSALLTIRLAGYFSANNPQQNIAFGQNEDGSYAPLPPGEIAALLNKLMLEELDTELYFTIAYADIDLKTGKTSLVQAGHPHPVVISKSGDVNFIGEGGPPIGLIEGLEFDSFETTLTPGDKLMLYSDGITECEDPQGNLLDEDGLSRVLKKHQTASKVELLKDIVWELTHFAQGKKFGDDVSAILFEFYGNS